ncbi:MAG: helix-turn-helix transcriptional regulator [Anaerovoracaceae bacterium]
MTPQEFALRLSRYREQKGVSARQMSIDLQQNHAYMNNLENARAFPRMGEFFRICEYFGITPQDFFKDEMQPPAAETEILLASYKKLTKKQRTHIRHLIEDLAELNNTSAGTA